MSESVTLGAVAAPTTIEHGGVEYRFGALTRRLMDEFSGRLLRRDRERLCALYGSDQTLLAERLRELEGRALSGEYDFLEHKVLGTPVLKKETRSIEGKPVEGVRLASEGGELHSRKGQVLLASVLTGRSEDECLALMLARPAEAAHALALTLARSLGGTEQKGDGWRPLTQEGTDPNPPCPA